MSSPSTNQSNKSLKDAPRAISRRPPLGQQWTLTHRREGERPGKGGERGGGGEERPTNRTPCTRGTKRRETRSSASFTQPFKTPTPTLVSPLTFFFALSDRQRHVVLLMSNLYTNTECRRRGERRTTTTSDSWWTRENMDAPRTDGRTFAKKN